MTLSLRWVGGGGGVPSHFRVKPNFWLSYVKLWLSWGFDNIIHFGLFRKDLVCILFQKSIFYHIVEQVAFYSSITSEN